MNQTSEAIWHLFQLRCGDTTDVLNADRAKRNRPNGIDCPETRQAYGMKAMQVPVELAFAKLLTGKTYGHDSVDGRSAMCSCRRVVCQTKSRLKKAPRRRYREYALFNVTLIRFIAAQ